MKTKKILYILIVLVIILLGFALYKKFYNPKTDSQNQQLTDKQVSSLVKKVSKLILVPDEKPVVATILKADELIAEQKFYAGSKNGDYLIVFPEAKKAIIYRAKEDKLINVGPIIVDQNAAQNTQQAPATTTDKKATSTKSE